MDIIYMGAFLQEQLDGVLKNKTKDQHITFKFKPEQQDMFSSELVGQEFNFLVSKYACDGKNEGFFVELPNELLPYYKNPSPPHITISTDGGKPVDTGKLTGLVDIERTFTVKARLGYYTNCGIVYEVIE
jgi:hypothetical protein